MSTAKKVNSDTDKELRNEDPLSGEKGAHPVGTGVGAALGGAAVGAAAGLAGGPVGAVVGAVAGGVAGGLTGKAVAEGYDPTIETQYWRAEYPNRPYYNEQYTYEHYEPAYRAGWETYDTNVDEEWRSRESLARERWENEGGETYMSWDEARHASEDAFARVRTAQTKKPR